MKRAICFALCFACSSEAVDPPGPRAMPTPAPASSRTPLWFEDNNLAMAGALPPDFKARFLEPDTWRHARAGMHTFMIRTNAVRAEENGLDEAFLREHMAPVLGDVQVVLDVTEAAWLSHRIEVSGQTVEQFLGRTRRVIELFEAAGIPVAGLSLQSVLSKPLPGHTYPMRKRVEDVVSFVGFIHSFRPDMPIGLIDALPTKGKPYRGAYQAVVTELAEAGSRLDHILLDLPWEVAEEARNGMSWDAAQDVEDFVQDTLGVRFGLSLFSRSGGEDSARAFHENTLASLQAYPGEPDFYAQLAFFPHPAQSIPDSDPLVFTTLRTFAALTLRRP